MLLKEQGTLQTPVGVFSTQHELVTAEPDQAQFYKQLIPLSKPKSGEQYAFKVDLDKCTGCKACVSACHSLNGLEDHETWRDVGLIHGTDLTGASYSQTVTTACHHCADPACLNGCPVLAYEKDEETGIVRHLDDQCIGCQYCALKCPYDVPKYSKSLGIVRKCDMCQSRLAEGEAPACVQACPTEAISITIVDIASLDIATKTGVEMLATAPSSDYTSPTTQYVTNRDIPDNVEAGDIHKLKAEHAHYPLVVMLVLTQLSVGMYAAALLTEVEEISMLTRVAAFIAMIIGLGASTSHLGRPLGAWRAFLGLRKSWLSREIVIFGAFSSLAFAYTASAFIEILPSIAVFFLGSMTVLSGLLGVFCSAMIYHDTQRPFWKISISSRKFFGTVINLGLAGYLTASVGIGAEFRVSFVALLSVIIVKLACELQELSSASQLGILPAKKSALLMLGPLRLKLISRYVCCGLGLITYGFLMIEPASIALALTGFLLLTAGELLERTLYFQAVSAPKMPGGTIA